MSAPNNKNTPAPLSFAFFLESVPPGSIRTVSDLFEELFLSEDEFMLSTPDTQLHCSTETCRGIRIFECGAVHGPFERDVSRNHFLTYICRNCKKGLKTYALLVRREQDESGSAVKYGERHAFGPPLPARLLNMVGDDRDLLLKGRRTENQGLGIGAFAYYRLVVENQKDRLLAEIRRAAERLGADEEQLRSIERAIKETRFSKAIDLVKDAIPDGLKVKGHNPLTLLHGALSKGVHGHSDEECLAQAQAVRIVLTDLVTKIAQVTKDESELDDAISKLL